MISLSADEVERRFSVLGIPNRFTYEEKQLLTTTAIVGDDDALFAFPTPRANTGLNILDLRKILGTDPARQPSFFDHPWYLDEEFARNDCPVGWHCLYSAVLPESVSQPFHYEARLRDRGLAVPSAVEVALMLFLHYTGTREQLLQKKHTWCKDVASMDRHVTVGAFGRNGLFVSGHPAEYASRGLGICPKVTR